MIVSETELTMLDNELGARATAEMLVENSSKAIAVSALTTRIAAAGPGRRIGEYVYFENEQINKDGTARLFRITSWDAKAKKWMVDLLGNKDKTIQYFVTPTDGFAVVD